MGLNSTGDSVEVRGIDVNKLGNESFLSGVDLEVGFMQSNKRDVEEQFSVDEMGQSFLQRFGGMMANVDQVFFFEYHGQNLKIKVKGSFTQVGATLHLTCH